MATNVVLIAGTVMMIPTTLTGWRTWKNSYREAKGFIFRRKISISLIMMSVSVPLTIWRFAFLDAFDNPGRTLWHWFYFAGNLLLIFGAIGEGYYGARLNHR